MEIVINTPGTYLTKKDERFVIKLQDKTGEYAAKNISRILITTSSSMSTDALKLAIENNIDVVFLDYFGNPYGRVWHSKLGSIATIRRKQLKLVESQVGMEFIKSWVLQKVDNQVELLEKLKSNRSDDKKKKLDNSIKKINEYRKKIEEFHGSVDEIRNSIEGYEGNISKVYFKALASIIPEKYEFKGRSRNPAKDMFNCMLNYSYGVLYSRVEKACIISGLDPYIGIMHTDNYNKKALTFDLIEMYRGYMDEIVFQLFAKRLVKKEMFDEIIDGMWLNKKGKELLIKNINEIFVKKIRYKGKNMELNNIIQYDCHNIANKILKEYAI